MAIVALIYILIALHFKRLQWNAAITRTYSTICAFSANDDDNADDNDPTRAIKQSVHSFPGIFNTSTKIIIVIMKISIFNTFSVLSLHLASILMHCTV